MRTGRIVGFQEKKERLVDFIKKDTKLNPAYLLPELVGICKIARKVSTITVYATGAVDCSSSKGCDFVDHKRCTMARAREVANEFVDHKNKAIAKAKVIIDGLVKTDNP